jgi:hypothetical protein
MQGDFDGFVSVGQRIVAICKIVISTAMRTTSVAYTRSTGSCVVLEKSISGICAVIEKSISDICADIEKSISTHCLVH